MQQPARRTLQFQQRQQHDANGYIFDAVGVHADGFDQLALLTFA